MIDIFAYSFTFGVFVGWLLFKHRGEDTTTLYQKIKDLQRIHTKELEYYKKLCKTLVDENTEFRRKINEQ